MVDAAQASNKLKMFLQQECIWYSLNYGAKILQYMLFNWNISKSLSHINNWRTLCKRNKSILLYRFLEFRFRKRSNFLMTLSIFVWVIPSPVKSRLFTGIVEQFRKKLFCCVLKQIKQYHMILLPKQYYIVYNSFPLQFVVDFAI